MIHENAQNSVTESMLSDSQQAIFAWATPPGRSGVAVLRISGHNLAPIAQALGMAALPPARQAALRALSYEGQSIDEALVLYFKAPYSFTGEEVLELQTHGSLAVRQRLLDVLVALPYCRPAQAGEFTRRAFLNGKMDLAQIEGLADVIEAQSSAQLQLALKQMHGTLSDYFNALRDQMIEPLALIEAYIDFPDEEIPEEVLEQINNKIASLRQNIAELLLAQQGSEKVREGFKVAIIGPPNAGKSSLINLLAHRDVAIVSNIAGTTRDTIEVQLELNGFLVTLADTAGIHETPDEIEQMGIARSKQIWQEADVTLAIFDIITIPELDKEILAKLTEDSLIILNKSDQAIGDVRAEHLPVPSIAVSTKTGENIGDMLAQLEKRLALLIPKQEDILLTHARHRQCLNRALSYLEGFSHQSDYECMAEELRLAAVEVGKITGKIEVDQLLDKIFSTFCIGK